MSALRRSRIGENILKYNIVKDGKLYIATTADVDNPVAIFNSLDHLTANFPTTGRIGLITFFRMFVEVNHDGPGGYLVEISCQGFNLCCHIETTFPESPMQGLLNLLADKYDTDVHVGSYGVGINYGYDVEDAVLYVQNLPHVPPNDGPVYDMDGSRWFNGEPEVSPEVEAFMKAEDDRFFSEFGGYASNPPPTDSPHFFWWDLNHPNR
jgi:hypothetical protein